MGSTHLAKFLIGSVMMPFGIEAFGVAGCCCACPIAASMRLRSAFPFSYYKTQMTKFAKTALCTDERCFFESIWMILGFDRGQLQTCGLWSVPSKNTPSFCKTSESRAPCIICNDRSLISNYSGFYLVHTLEECVALWRPIPKCTYVHTGMTRPGMWVNTGKSSDMLMFIPQNKHRGFDWRNSLTEECFPQQTCWQSSSCIVFSMGTAATESCFGCIEVQTNCVSHELTGFVLSCVDRHFSYVGKVKEVAPIIAGYWERAEFPFCVLPKLKELNIGGLHVKYRGCSVWLAVNG